MILGLPISHCTSAKSDVHLSSVSLRHSIYERCVFWVPPNSRIGSSIKPPSPRPIRLGIIYIYRYTYHIMLIVYIYI